jgi:hypothetical protein
MLASARLAMVVQLYFALVGMAVRRLNFKIPMGLRQGKFVMDQSDRRVELEENSLVDVKRILLKNGRLDEAELGRRSWNVFCIDDKAIFEDDACRLGNAFKTQGASSFLVARVSDLLTGKRKIGVYRFEASEAGIEEFQGPSYREINLEDCLLFNLPITCVVFRPGGVDVTTFAGDIAFIGEMRK